MMKSSRVPPALLMDRASVAVSLGAAKTKKRRSITPKKRT
jgi:hypothetical protein